MEFGITDLSIVPVRKEPSDKSEMVTQLLFGEHFEIRERNKQWLRIHTWFDDYDGWIDQKQIQKSEPRTHKELSDLSVICSSENVGIAESNSRRVSLLLGSSLPNWNSNKFSISTEEFEFKGRVTSGKTEPEKIISYGLRFTSAPYLWGGRSLFGVDCSGFTHVVFKLAGIKLKRDAWQQSEQGVLIPFIDQARPGDLAFFHNEEGKITHTGIILEGNKIIHASGRVRIDSIDHFGIFNEVEKKYSHHLRFIRRIIA